MKGFVATFIAIFVICAFAACESAPASDGTTRFAWSPYNGPGSDPVYPPEPPGPKVPEPPVPGKHAPKQPGALPAEHGSI